MKPEKTVKKDLKIDKMELIWSSKTIVSLSEAQIAKIIEWMYVHDGQFPSRSNWRHAFVKFLKEMR